MKGENPSAELEDSVAFLRPSEPSDESWPRLDMGGLSFADRESMSGLSLIDLMSFEKLPDLSGLTPEQLRILTLLLHDRSQRFELALSWEQQRSESLALRIRIMQSNRGLRLLARLLKWNMFSEKEDQSKLKLGHWSAP
jgi:hypothetical protein